MWEGLSKGESGGTLGRVFECYVRHLFLNGGGVKLKKRRLYGALNKGSKPNGPESYTIPNGLE